MADPQGRPKPHSVAIVVDPNFGQQLNDLCKRIHVWFCGSEANTAAAEKILEKFDPAMASLDSGVTGFKYDAADTKENILLDILATVDEHHNHLSHDPTWTTMEIFGVPLTEVIRETLENDYGCDEFTENAMGFIAKRKNWSALH